MRQGIRNPEKLRFPPNIIPKSFEQKRGVHNHKQKISKQGNIFRPFLILNFQERWRCGLPMRFWFKSAILNFTKYVVSGINLYSIILIITNTLFSSRKRWFEVKIDFLKYIFLHFYYYTLESNEIFGCIQDKVKTRLQFWRSFKTQQKPRNIILIIVLTNTWIY